MAKALGSSFGDALIAAGLGGLAISWSPDGTFTYGPGITDAQKTAVAAVVAAYNPVTDALISYAASVRFKTETGGITVSGAPVETDRATQAQLTGAAVMAQANSGFTTQWKNADGSFTSLSAPQIIAIATAVATHVAACFAAEATMVAGIKAATVTTNAQIDAAFAAVT